MCDGSRRSAAVKENGRAPSGQADRCLSLRLNPDGAGHAVFLMARWRVRGGFRVPLGRPGPGVRDFGAKKGVEGEGEGEGEEFDFGVGFRQNRNASTAGIPAQRLLQGQIASRRGVVAALHEWRRVVRRCRTPRRRTWSRRCRLAR